MDVIELPESSDQRGLSFSLLVDHLRTIGRVEDVHIAAIGPGHVRGNHYHLERGELIAVVYQGPWSLHWDTGPDTARRQRDFTGRGAVAIAPPVTWSHAIRNDGDTDLWIFVVSDRPYDGSSDTVTRKVAD